VFALAKHTCGGIALQVSFDCLTHCSVVQANRLCQDHPRLVTTTGDLCRHVSSEV
jgi:hypothetical protein